MGRIVRNLLSVCVRRRMLIPRSRSAECLSAAENPTAEDLVPVNDGNQDRVTLVVPKTAAMTQVSTAEFFLSRYQWSFMKSFMTINLLT